MRYTRSIFVSAILAAVFGAGTLCAADPSPVSDDAALARLQELSAGTQVLYRRVSAGMIRVRVEHNPESLIRPELRQEWEQYRDRFLRSGPGMGPRGGQGGPGAGRPEGRGDKEGRESREGRGEGRPELKTDVPARGDGPGRPGRDHPAANDPRGLVPGKRPGPAGAVASTQPAGRMNPVTLAMLQRFFELRAMDANPAKAKEATHILARLRAIRQSASGEMYAVIYDSAGHALLLTAVVLPSDKTTLSATMSDGVEISAKVVATNFVRGYTILKIEPKGDSLAPAATFNPRGENRPAPGELLMSITPGSGAVAWVSAPSQNFSKKRREERFPLANLDERSGAYVFNTKGDLVAVALERAAVPVSILAEEIKMMEDGKSILPQTLGVKFEAVLPTSDEHKANKLLGRQAALKVTSVFAGSSADKAGIKEGDFITLIDNRPVNQVAKMIEEEWPTRTSPVRITIVRGDQTLEKELTMDRGKD